MATREVVELCCDLCGTVDLVATHTIAVDGVLVEFETCDSDYARLMEAFAIVGAVGRKVKQTTRKRAKRDERSWEFSSHSLIRMGERHVKPDEALAVLDDPDLRFPGNDPDCEVFIRDGVKVVVDHTTTRIVTVSRRVSEAESLIAG